TLEIDQIRVFYELAVVEVVKALEDQANSEIRGTLERRKISVGEYGRILKAVKRDPSLRRKAQQIARDEGRKLGKPQTPPPSAEYDRDAPPPNGGPPVRERTSWQPR